MAKISQRIRSGGGIGALMAPGASRVVLFRVGKVVLALLGVAGVRIAVPDGDLDSLAGALAQLIPIMAVVAHEAIKWWRKRGRKGGGNHV